jgi:hypothetical protein
MNMPMNLFRVHWLVTLLAPFGTARAERKDRDSPEEAETLFLFRDNWLAAYGSGHLPDRP